MHGEDAPTYLHMFDEVSLLLTAHIHPCASHLWVTTFCDLNVSQDQLTHIVVVSMQDPQSLNILEKDHSISGF